MVALTNGDTECTDYAECLALVQNGTSIAYRGRSGPLHLSANGEPTEAGAAATAVAASQYGLELEPTYTAKAFACALSLVADGRRVVFVNTAPS